MCGAPTQKPNCIFWHCPIQTRPSQVSKNTFAGLWGTVVSVFGAPPQNPNKHPPAKYPKTPFLAQGVQRYGRGMGAIPEFKQLLFSIVQFEHPHPRYPKTPLLAYGPQWYGCLGRRRKPQKLFFSIVPGWDLRSIAFLSNTCEKHPKPRGQT